MVRGSADSAGTPCPYFVLSQWCSYCAHSLCYILFQVMGRKQTRYHVHKRTKRSKTVRASLATKKSLGECLPASASCPEETSDDIFDKLLASTSFNDPNPKTYQNNDPGEKSGSEDCVESDVEMHELHDLIVEYSDCKEEVLPIKGRRIVDIGHIIEEIRDLVQHNKSCTMGRLEFVREVRRGLFSKFHFHCDNCGKDRYITTEPEEKENEVNDALVWGAVSVGIGFSQAEELFGIINVPVMSAKTFRKHEIRVGKVWEEYMTKKMLAHAEEEKRIAIEKGNLLNGKPFITVIGDGGWAKRSYGHGMNSASGVGIVIGAETKKILFLGVRNKFCYVCNKAKLEKKDIPNHICYKNYCGPSTGMETSVIVEAFKRSEQDYGLIYRNYIGDGDSSVFARIQEGCSYGRYVRKVECANHMTRALNDNLHKLATNTSFPLESRRLLSAVPDGKSISRLERLVKGVRAAIKQAGSSKSSKDIEVLRQDLRNAPNHVFGEHSRCRDSFCKSNNATKEPNVLQSLNPIFTNEIHKLIDRLVRKANSLVANATTNCAERYMGLVSKFTGGKRVNVSTRGSYRRRCFAAGLSHSRGPSWHFSPWKSMQGRSPGEVFKNKLSRREKSRSKRALQFSVEKTKKRPKRSAGYDQEYGPMAVEADIEEDELQKKMDNLMKTLKSEVEEWEQLERQTVGQHNNTLWMEKRLNRITASNFGQVVKRLDHTPCHNLVKSILYPKELNTEGVAFGRLHEKIAIQQYEIKTGNKVDSCGLFCDPDNPFLGASPDGLVGDDGLVEVKCLPSVKEKLVMAVETKKNLCVEVNAEKKLKIKKKHSYYYQIQGQLNITRRKWCDLVLYTGIEEVYIDRIHVDTNFWTEIMLPKLCRFFKECVLPEIVDSRVVRKLKIRDPEYILEARKKIENAKK